MRKTRFIFLSALFAMIIVSSCKKEDPVVEADLLSQEVESVVAISNLPAYITATDLYSKITAQQAPYMFDIRAAADYSDGHIEGAANVSASDLLSEVETNVSNMSDEIVVICYSGQSAAFGASLLKLSGYTNVKSLKFGMTSWHSDFDSWSGNVSTYYAQFLETTENTKPEEGNLPEINTGYETAEEILDSRIETVMTEGFGAYAIAASAVTDSPSNYHIANYWPVAHYTSPGHIEGSFCYVPGESLTLATDLKTLPTDETVVVYCYTGQTSAWVSAYLAVLGYDVKSLKFGANSMFTGDLPSSNWNAETMVAGYDYISN